MRANRRDIVESLFIQRMDRAEMGTKWGREKGTGGFFSFAKDPDDTNEEQLSHEESFHDERT